MLGEMEALEFVRDEKGWVYHKKGYYCLVDPEDDAEPVEVAHVSRRRVPPPLV